MDRCQLIQWAVFSQSCFPHRGSSSDQPNCCLGRCRFKMEYTNHWYGHHVFVSFDLISFCWKNKWNFLVLAYQMNNFRLDFWVMRQKTLVSCVSCNFRVYYSYNSNNRDRQLYRPATWVLNPSFRWWGSNLINFRTFLARSGSSNFLRHLRQPNSKQLLRAGNYVLRLADDNDYLTVNNRGDLGSTSNLLDPLIRTVIER